MPAGADRDDAGATVGACGGQHIVQAGGKPHVVGGELHLPPLLGTLELGQYHDPGVVDEDVQRVFPGGDKGRNGALIGEVERCDAEAQISSGRGNIGCGVIVGVSVALGKRHLRPGAGKCPGSLNPDARGVHLIPEFAESKEPVARALGEGLSFVDNQILISAASTRRS